MQPPSGHMRYPGTITVPPDVYRKVLESAARSLRLAGFRDIVVLGEHGDYQKDNVTVARELNREWAAAPVRVHAIGDYYRVPTAWFAQALKTRGYSDAEIGLHAGLADTSLMLAIDPTLVRADRLQPAPGQRGCPASPAIRGARRPNSARSPSTRSSRRRSTPCARRSRATEVPAGALPPARFSTRIHPAPPGALVKFESVFRPLAAAVAVLSCVALPASAQAPAKAPAAAASAGGRDGAGHAAGRQRRQPVQRDDRRQAEPRGRRRPAARVRAAHPVERRLRDRSRDVPGDRQVQGGPQSAARGAVVGPAHAVGREQRREHDQGQPDARRSEDRQGGQADPRRRSLQHVLHAGRQVGDRRRRGDEAARLPRPEDDGDAVLDRRAEVRGHQPRGLLDRRPLRDLHVRVHRAPSRRSTSSSARCWATRR